MPSSLSSGSAWDMLRRAPALVLLMFIVRFTCIKYIYRPLGLRMRINPDKPRRVVHNTALEELYQTYGTKASKNERLGELASQEGMTLDEAQHWLTKRHMQDDEPDLDKFNYECWMTTYYLLFNIYGISIIRKKTWFWNIEDCWITFAANVNYDTDMNLYFNVSFAFFVLDTLILLTKNYERKDYYMIRIHHIASGLLILVAWHFNMIRIGAVLLFLAEVVTPFPYVSRLSQRIQSPMLADVSFFFFAILWALIRVYLAHFWILSSYVNYRMSLGRIVVRDVIIDSVVTVLAVINLQWTWVILKKFKKVFFSGKYKNPFRAMSLALAKRG